MDILANYKQCLTRIIALQKETRDNASRSEAFKRDLELAQQQIETLKAQAQTASDVQIRQKLSEMISTERNGIMRKMDIIQKEISSIQEAAVAEKNQVQQEINIGQHRSELAMISRAEDVLNKSGSIIRDSTPQTILASVENAVVQDTHTYDLLRLIQKVEEMYSKVPDTVDVSVFRQVVNWIMLDTSKFSNWKPRTRMYVYILWLIALLAVLVYAPYFFMVPYTLLLGTSIYTNLGRSQVLMNFCYPYLLLQERTRQARSQLEQSVEIQRGRRYQEINQKRDAALQTKQQELSKLNAQLGQVDAEVRSRVSASEIASKVQNDYQLKIEQEGRKLTTIQNSLTRMAKYNECNARNLEQTLADKEQLKEEVKKYYLNPSTPGESKLLTTSFFLGMDDREDLIEFDYKGKTTLVLYRGDNNTVNAPLITMMLMQLLASMSIVSLQLAITDVRNACTSYAPFSPNKLSNRIRLCATDEEIKNILDLYHTELLMRNKTILTEAPSIEEFNKQMLERKSLTREYYLLFFQDPDPKILGSQKFLQLCRSGPLVGIVPLVFIQHTALAKMKTESPQVVSGLVEFFESVSTNTFIFNGATQDLKDASAASGQIIDEFRKALVRR